MISANYLCLSLFLLFLHTGGIVSQTVTCSGLSSKLKPENAHYALLGGVTFLDTPSPSSPEGYHICLRAGSAAAGYSTPKRVTIDTGSLGVVLPESYLKAGSFTRTDRCRAFNYVTSNNAYFGEFVSTSLKFFGNDPDGRYFDTHPLIILAVKYSCDGDIYGKGCMDILAGRNDDNCTEMINFLTTNKTAIERWKTAETTIGMVGIAFNRGNSEADLTLGAGPYPLSRNPFLKVKVNSSALSAHLPPSPMNPIAPSISSYCLNILSATPKSPQTKCFRDSLDKEFSLNSSFIFPASLTTSPSSPSPPTAGNGGVYAYILSSTKVRFLVSSPYQINPLSTPVFQCGVMNTIPVSNQWADGAPSFTCWDSETYECRSELLSTNSLSSSVIWRGRGSLMPDSGIKYYVHNVPNYPCMTGKHAVKLYLHADAVTNPLVWSFTFDMNQPLETNYYATEKSSDNFLPPTKFRIWKYGSGSGCQNLNVDTVWNNNINSGRMLLSSFVYLFDALNGVMAFANATEFESSLAPIPPAH